MCLEYEYKTLAAVGRYQVTEARIYKETSTEKDPLPTSPINLTESTLLLRADVDFGGYLSVAEGPTCILPNTGCRPGVPGTKAQNIPIEERTWGTPTARSPKLGEVAMRNDGNAGSVEQVTNRVRLVRMMAMLGGFAGVMVVL